MNKLARSMSVVATVTVTAVLGAAAPAMADHEHLVQITNPHTGEVTCQYIARGATPTNDNFHDRAHTGPGRTHRGDVAFIEKEGTVVQNGACDVTRGRQTVVVEPH